MSHSPTAMEGERDLLRDLIGRFDVELHPSSVIRIFGVIGAQMPIQVNGLAPPCGQVNRSTRRVAAIAPRKGIGSSGRLRGDQSPTEFEIHGTRAGILIPLSNLTIRPERSAAHPDAGWGGGLHDQC